MNRTKVENGRRRGEQLSAISAGAVALLKEFYRRGPTEARSYYEDDLVVCVLRGGRAHPGERWSRIGGEPMADEVP